MKGFSLSHHIQTGSEAHIASYPIGTGSSFPEVKQPKHEAEVTNLWSYTSTLHIFSWCGI
jgi:hypothetical protein